MRGKFSPYFPLSAHPLTASETTRLKLVVQLRRFVITDAHRRLNLASQCLGRALREGDASNARLAEIGRKHWSVENKNHWRKDATVWREDRGVRHKPRGAKNLAPLRNAILVLIEPGRHDSLNQAFLHDADHRAEALRLIPEPIRKILNQPIALHCRSRQKSVLPATAQQRSSGDQADDRIAGLGNGRPSQ
jgi:hypothetical protein